MLSCVAFLQAKLGLRGVLQAVAGASKEGKCARTNGRQGALRLPRRAAEHAPRPVSDSYEAVSLRHVGVPHFPEEEAEAQKSS